MELRLDYDRPEEGPGSGPLTVGWFLASDKGAVLYDPPERVQIRPPNKAHAKSASRCPAVIQLESRYFMVKCPFDLHIGFQRDDKGKAVLVNRAGAASPIRSSKLNEVLTLVTEAEWRFPDRPTVQLHLPYYFIADEMVYLTQLAAFAHYRPDPLARHDLWRAVPDLDLAAAADVGLRMARAGEGPDPEARRAAVLCPVRGDGPQPRRCRWWRPSGRRSCRPIWRRSRAW